MAERIITKSDYTALRNRSQKTSKGDIYENNLMTISPLDDLFSDDQAIVPSQTNFKFSVRTGVNQQKKHHRGGWILNESGETWTYQNLGDSVTSDESIVRIKPNYTSIKDFAYYGSAVEMIKGAVGDVILRFPAELYFSDKKLSEVVFDETKDVPDENVVINDLGIDLYHDNVNNLMVNNPMRFMCLNAANYEKYNSSGKLQISACTFSVSYLDKTCSKGLHKIATATIEGESINIWEKDGKEKYYTHNSTVGTYIRPNQQVIDAYFNTIDEFEAVLLNRESNPVYKSTFETPYETDHGNRYVMEDYIWPSTHNWNPDVSSAAYSIYIGRLAKMASFYDEYYTNNIWRSMTHEAIKNLDWTFTRQGENGSEDLSSIDSSRIEAMMQLYGRMFDGVKRYIDNLKCANNVTYDERNNLPDYLLSDAVELSGWEAYSLIPTAKTSNMTEGPLYSGWSQGSSEVDANIFFNRVLKINSQYINSIKGTKNGVDTMMGLLGLKPDEYSMEEKVAIAKPKENYCKFVNLSAYTDIEGLYSEEYTEVLPRFEDVERINMMKDTYASSGDSLQGLALKQITKYDSAGSITMNYVVPWFNGNEEHDGRWYFQCKGGWGALPYKEISLGITNASAITSTDDLQIYEETETYLKFATTLNELVNFTKQEIKEGMVCFVTDVDGNGHDGGIFQMYRGVSSLTQEELEKLDENTLDERFVVGESGTIPSHYYILKNIDYSGFLGIGGVDDDGKAVYGWQMIPNSCILDLKEEPEGERDKDALKAVYLESIINKTEGNNPHTGIGDYDMGQEYIDYISDIFKYSTENNNFTEVSDKDKENISGYTFDISTVIDNRKCWAFTDNEYLTTDESAITIGEECTEGYSDEFNELYGSSRTKSKTSPYDFETKETDITESAANSVINLKNLTITFNVDNEFFKKYIMDIVLPYIEQVIPSTTILEYKFSESEEPKEEENDSTENTKIIETI